MQDFKGDRGAIRLPGQGASVGLRSAIGPVRPSGVVSDRRELSSGRGEGAVSATQKNREVIALMVGYCQVTVSIIV